MATRTSTTSGLWSATGTWVGGVCPADGDAVVIAAGHSVLCDVDMSGWANGLAGVTIQGSATTPGMLYVMNGYSAWLKIKTGNTITGTSGANKGRILGNSDGVWGNTGVLSFANKFVIDLQGTAFVDATYLDIKCYCAEPANKYVTPYFDKYAVSSINTLTGQMTLASAHGWSAGRTVKVRVNGAGTLPAGLSADLEYYVYSPSGSTLYLCPNSGTTTPVIPTDSGTGTIEIYSGYQSYSGVTTVNVLEDVTSDYWSTASGHNAVVLVNEHDFNNGYDQQRTTIANITSESITLGNALDSVQYAGARIYLSSRNISIRSNGTSTSQNIITAASGCNFGLEIRNTAGSGTTVYGRGLYSSYNNTVSGTVSGCYLGLHSSYNNTVSGTISGCNFGQQINNSRNSLIDAVQPVTMPLSGRNSTGGQGRLICTAMNRVANAHKIYDNFGDILHTLCNGSGNAPSVDPLGGNDYCREASNIQSNCGYTPSSGAPRDYLRIIDNQRIWLKAGTYTISYKLQTTYAAGLSSGNLSLSAQYIGTNNIISTVTSNATAVSTRTSAADWSQSISVTFTQAIDGYAYLNLDLLQYESGKEVYVWPVPYGTGYPRLTVKWTDGIIEEASLPVDLYPVAGYLCTLDDVKAWLGITVTTDDSLLQRLITGASEAFRTATGRNFDVRTYTEIRSGSGQRTLFLWQNPIQSITSLTIDGVAIPAIAGNVYSPGANGYLYTETDITLYGYEFTKGKDNVSVVYSAGYSTIPYDVQQAAIELVCFKYREKDRIGHASKSIGGETVSFVIKDMPPSVKSVLNKYNRIIPV